MEPRWHITRNQIAELLETHGLEVRCWEVYQNVFEGAIVDGYKPEQFTRQVNSTDREHPAVSNGETIEQFDCAYRAHRRAHHGTGKQ